MIGVEPLRRLTYLLHVFYGIQPTAQIANINRLRILRARDAIPEPPHFQHTIHMRLVVLSIKRIGSIRLRRRSATQFLK